MTIYYVKQQKGSRQYGVYLDDKLFEGGFFSKSVALSLADRLNYGLRYDAMSNAERLTHTNSDR